MGEWWNHFRFQLLFFAVLMLLLEIQECDSLNSEGMALLEFHMRINKDPYGAFANWNPNDADPCNWLGILCVDGKVHMLNLGGFSLEGILASELAHLTQLRSLVLYKNGFSGFVPKEIGWLHMLELLDLRHNNLTGEIPVEIGKMRSLKHLLLCGNNFQGSIPLELEKLILFTDLQSNQNLTTSGTIEADCINRKLGHRTGRSGLRQLESVSSYIVPIKGTLLRYMEISTLFKFGRRKICEDAENCSLNQPSLSEPWICNMNVENMVNIVRRRLSEVSSNLPAIDATGAPEELAPVTLRSGSFCAVNVPSSSNQEPYSTLAAGSNKPAVQQPLNSGSSKRVYVFVVPTVAFIFTLCALMLVFRRKTQEEAKDASMTGLGCPSQKAFISGVTRLCRSELEAACEDFSNILFKFLNFIVYKGILSGGVEIAVVSTTVTLYEDWSHFAEKAFRRKIDTLSRVNHVNFVKLIGYCNENEPFTRMLVVEYVPNGTLYEHLHVKEAEHLDWKTRVRIIMGIAYCLEHMHHYLDPPVAHPNLETCSILLTEDYAAKVLDIDFWTDNETTTETFDEGESEHSYLLQQPSPRANVYNFGMMLLETISGKLNQEEKDGSHSNWATEYLGDKEKISKLIDTSLESFKQDELEKICEVIQACISYDPRHRLTMREIISKLREVIAISQNTATPKSSPLLWAELEILSMEAA